MDRRIVAITLILSLSVILFLAITTQRITNHSLQTEGEWPAFSMVFKEEDGNFSMIKDGSLGTQVYEYVYKNSKDWKITITESPSIDIKGTWRSYNGKTITNHQARTEKAEVEDATELEGIFVPNQWLNPLYYAKLTKKPNVEKLNDAPAGYERWRMTEIDCHSLHPLTNFIPQNSEDCDPAYQIRMIWSDFTYRSDYHIPVKVNYLVDGSGVYTATVEKLEIKQ